MQGFNMGRYVPPDLEGKVSFNKASGKGHALGARASKLKTEGVLVVRFECPFAIWCTTCHPEQIISQGVRFNAEKKRVGSYFSTPIWSFRIKHNVCGGVIEVRTDPQNAEYVVVEGGRRRDTGVDKVLDGEIVIGGAATEEEKMRLERDGGFGVLEKKLEDKREADTQKRRIDELAQRSERDWADPYEMSRRLRKEFRVGRRKRQADEKSGEALQDKFGLEMDMVAPNEQDAERTALIEFGQDKIIETSSKPMFPESKVGLPYLNQMDRGKSSKKSINSLVVQKAVLQNTLKGNTRNTLDPFLSAETSLNNKQWHPNLKRQRIEVHEGNERDERKEVLDTLDTGKGKALVCYDSDSS